MVRTELAIPAASAIDGDLVLIDALEEVRRDLRLPAGAVDTPRAALRTDELARPGRRRPFNVPQPAAPPAHARPRRQHARALVLEHRRRMPAREEPLPAARHARDTVVSSVT